MESRVSRTRVLVDLLFFTGTKGGMETYARELYRQIGSNPEFEFIGFASRELAAAGAPWFPGRLLDSGISGENRVTWAWGELFAVARAARKAGADLIHSPANFGPARSAVPVVLNVHDLLPFRHPEWVPGPYAPVLRQLVRVASRRAARVLTLSAASRADIMKYLDVDPWRIDVIPLAGSAEAGTDDGEAARQRTRLLAVGNRMPHKNFTALISAMSLIDPESRPQLTITGSHGDDPLEILVTNAGLQEWVHLAGWLSSEQLDELYAQSTLFVFPTRFEGFGLPVLEAMSRGCPVACSDIGVLHEVAGDSAYYFDPQQPASIAQAITHLLAHPEELAAMSQAGRRRAGEFSWQRVADQTLESFAAALRAR